MLVNIVASRIGMSFFHLLVRFSNEVFSYCTLTEAFTIGFQNSFEHDWIDFGFFAGVSLISLLSCLYGLKSAIIAHLHFSFDDMKSFP